MCLSSGAMFLVLGGIHYWLDRFCLSTGEDNEVQKIKLDVEQDVKKKLTTVNSKKR